MSVETHRVGEETWMSCEEDDGEGMGKVSKEEQRMMRQSQMQTYNYREHKQTRDGEEEHAVPTYYRVPNTIRVRQKQRRDYVRKSGSNDTVDEQSDIEENCDTIIYDP
uniref:50S ribosomal protein L1P n=1 Tax=Lygus hesperus TaxID=30085 RepID=A0A0A9XET0_LYGHE